MEFVKFMSSGSGRLARVVAGAILIGIGIALGGGWLVLSLVWFLCSPVSQTYAFSPR